MNDGAEIDKVFFRKHPDISEYYRPPLPGIDQGDTVHVKLNRESGTIFYDELDRYRLGREEEQGINNAFQKYGWCEVSETRFYQ